MTAEDMERVLDDALEATMGIGPEWREIERELHAFGDKHNVGHLRPSIRAEKLAEARSLRAQGVKYDSIALELGVSKTTVSRWLS